MDTDVVRDTELLRRFERKILRMIYGPVRNPETGHYKMRSNVELAQIYQSPDIIQEIKSGRLRRAGHLQRSQNDRLIKQVWEDAPIGKRPLGKPRLRWRDNIIKDRVILGVDQQEWREMTHDRSRWRQIVVVVYHFILKSRSY